MDEDRELIELIVAAVQKMSQPQQEEIRVRIGDAAIQYDFSPKPSFEYPGIEVAGGVWG
jgi:hypothetical protein